jgi:mannosyltransferase OCH1-like enzyme
MEVHPDWKLFLWRDADIDRFGLKNQQEYDKSKDYAGKADIARYEILYRYGGMYIDADTIWLSKLDVSQFTGSLNMTKEKVKSAEKKDSTLVCNGFIVTVPGHPFLKIAIDTLPQRFSEKNGQGAWIATGPRHLTRLHKLISPVVDKDIHFVVMNDFLGLDWWGDMTEAKTLEHADRCKREGVFSLHWGFSTNKLSIPGEGVSEEEAAKFSPFLVKQ